MTVAPKMPAAGIAISVPGLLAAAYRRLTDACEALAVQVAHPGSAACQETVDGAELTASKEALEAFVEAEATRIRDCHGLATRRDVAASRAFHHYVWAVGLLMSGVWYLERRVPRIRPGDVRLDLAAGTFTILPGFDIACLADDLTAARLPGARVFAHEQALRVELRAAVADHVRPLLSALSPYIRRGPRALWGMVGDDLVSGIWCLGRALNQEGRAVQAATELLPSAAPPFPGGADFRRLAGSDGRRYPTRTRMGCCLYYTIRPGEACLTCPRTSDAERLRRLEG